MDSKARPRALVADDEPALAADLATRLGRIWPELDIAAVVHHGPAAVEALTRLSPDLAFLDIQMPGLSGLEVAEKARVPHLVFVTAHDQYAVAAFEAAAVDYLLKPVGDMRLAQTVDRLKARLANGAPAIDLAALLQRLSKPVPARLSLIRASVGAETHLIDIGSVLYFRADDKYTAVQTVAREYLIRTPLKELLTQLDPERFWQIHRNTIVNAQAVASAHRELTGRVTLHLKGRAEKLPVSRAFSHRFRQM
jgi:DNA-binding LytR/AlgR family response regulator